MTHNADWDLLNTRLDNLDTVLSTTSIIDEQSVITRYLYEKKLLTAVTFGDYAQAILAWNSLCESDVGIKDLEARIPNDSDRLYRNLAWNLNSVLRISILLAQVPVTYVHILATHFGMLIETIPLDMIKNQTLYRNMIQIYCYTAHKFNGKSYSRHVEKIVNFISFHIQENLTLTDISKEFNLSPVYINRILKKETGFTTIQFIKKQRITLAKMLLHFEDMTISQIAQIVGYSDCGYFCRVFKQLEGISPLQYKEMQGIQSF